VTPGCLSQGAVNAQRSLARAKEGKNYRKIQRGQERKRLRGSVALRTGEGKTSGPQNNAPATTPKLPDGVWQRTKGGATWG